MVIPEPLGGAHRNIHNTIYNVEQYIIKTLRDLKRTKIDNLLENRYKKLRALGSELQKPGRDKARQVKAGAKDIVKPEIPERLSIKAQLRKVHETAEAEAVEFAQEKGDD
jgi:hypothetical protein